jgi:ethanolamine utilization protein EutM
MEIQEGEALGLVETRGLIAGIEACDAMLKAAAVRLIGIEQTVPALITVKVVGETAAVRSACDAGAAAAERVGQVVSVHVIPRPAEGVRELLNEGAPRRRRAEVGRSEAGRATDLETLTVRELRDLARNQTDFPLRGREISRATKEQLLELLRGS